jgi:hypothetical protein
MCDSVVLLDFIFPTHSCLCCTLPQSHRLGLLFLISCILAFSGFYSGLFFLVSCYWFFLVLWLFFTELVVSVLCCLLGRSPCLFIRGKRVVLLWFVVVASAFLSFSLPATVFFCCLSYVLNYFNSVTDYFEQFICLVLFRFLCFGMCACELAIVVQCFCF